MNCPNCGGDTHVDCSLKGIDQVVRYRKCYDCNMRFKTIELEEQYARVFKKERKENNDR